MPGKPRKKFHEWKPQELPDTLEALIALYKGGAIGAYEDPEAEEAIRYDSRQMFGHDYLDDIATANGWADSGKGKLCLPYLHAEKLWPGCFPGDRQTVGSCVAHDAKQAMLVTLGAELASGQPDPVTGEMEGPPEVPTAGIESGVLHPAPHYWTRGYSGHGWSCATSARNSVDKVGAVICRNYEELGVDLTNVTRENECLYGSRQPPAEWQKIFGANTVRAVAQIKTFEALRDALWNGYGVSSCGSEGFSSSRDANGVAKRSGSWAHSMCVFGFDDRPEIHAIYGGPLIASPQSWGKTWNSGPRRILGTNIDLPPGAFWARWSDWQRRYLVVRSNVRGWPPRVLPGWGEDVLLN